MSDIVAVVSLVLAVVAIAVALWQGVTSQNQLTLARATNTTTETALAEIRRLTEDNRRIAEELKTAFDQRIGRVVDQALSSAERRADAEHQSDQLATGMTEKFLGFLGETLGPELKKALTEGNSEAVDATADDAVDEGHS